MDNFAIISRDDLSRRKVADEMRVAADKQAKYENQLKKMGIPVIVGLVKYSLISESSQRLIRDFSYRVQLIAIRRLTTD